MYIGGVGNLLHILEPQKKFQMNLILTISHNWSCGWGERLVFKVSKLVSQLSLTPFPLWKHHLWWRNSLMRFYGYKKGNVGSSLWEIMKEPEGVPQSAGGEVSSSLLKSCVLLRATVLEQKKSKWTLCKPNETGPDKETQKPGDGGEAILHRESQLTFWHVISSAVQRGRLSFRAIEAGFHKSRTCNNFLPLT